jgi:hypothetical protein
LGGGCVVVAASPRQKQEEKTFESPTRELHTGARRSFCGISYTTNAHKGLIDQSLA